MVGRVEQLVCAFQVQSRARDAGGDSASARCEPNQSGSGRQNSEPAFANTHLRRMSGVHPGSSPSKNRVPLWSIGVMALLVASRFARRPYAAPQPTRTTRVAYDGLARSATSPSEIA